MNCVLWVVSMRSPVVTQMSLKKTNAIITCNAIESGSTFRSTQSIIRSYVATRGDIRRRSVYRSTQ